uniref:Fatty acyl-CoA reductase n=1 Tax=Chromera velia CCMP2878 TaxID=1169474 RepID=A0A0G4FV69_9ALVE|eukprot:Cvel_3763.t1-p1 / transcript=Cvel_3763.t1 / gene=Cvel_3763 / organism=Chromera_velia_CCMP2878 / gene_product=Fatty acyl-CoA reductase 2, putative / transcript_product=Fatty acyl-CoA reductase 2, putative / location=Cvel_scaffold157:122061-124107(-) / protein_length=508 / sequence_SO=supercontig / SO=protein_coding / is_pseudo=false
MIVLITGATGFVGQAILFQLLSNHERLGLRKCYVIARAGKTESAKERVFQSLQKLGLGESLITSLVSVVTGDVTQPLASADFPGTSVLVNSAATVKFDLPKQNAIESNLGICKRVFALAASLPDLSKFIHISTAFVNAPQGATARLPFRFTSIEELEKFCHGEDLGGHPNTYTCSKNVCEEWLRIACQRVGMKLVIHRPSIVTGAVRTPYPGWVQENRTGMHAVAIAGWKGKLSKIISDPAKRLPIVPVDTVAELCLEEIEKSEDESPEFCVRHAACPPDSQSVLLGMGSLWSGACMVVGNKKGGEKLARRVESQKRMLDAFTFFFANDWDFGNDVGHLSSFREYAEDLRQYHQTLVSALYDQFIDPPPMHVETPKIPPDDAGRPVPSAAPFAAASSVSLQQQRNPDLDDMIQIPDNVLSEETSELRHRLISEEEAAACKAASPAVAAMNDRRTTIVNLSRRRMTLTARRHSSETGRRSSKTVSVNLQAILSFAVGELDLQGESDGDG